MSRILGVAIGCVAALGAFLTRCAPLIRLPVWWSSRCSREHRRSGQLHSRSRRRQNRSYGGPEVRGRGDMNGMVQDLRCARRQIRIRPGFTTTVVLTLAWAISVSTAVFSVICAMLIPPLPCGRPDRIVYLQPFSPQGYTQPAPYPEHLDWQRDNHVFSALIGRSWRRWIFRSINFQPKTSGWDL